MGVLGESWCFCKGVSKSEKMKATIFSGKCQALTRITGNGVSGTGFVIYRNLLLTAHVNVPSVFAAESSEIRLQNCVTASLVPRRFFITSSVLDLTIVGLDVMDGEPNGQGQQPHYLKTCSKPNLELGSVVYLLGYREKEELTIGEGKVVIATDNLIKVSTDGIMWSPGSAGFDAQGNLAFIICDPMKLATSPNTKSSSTSSSSTSSWKKDSPLQFGIPMPVICDWLNQHWEGSLDEPTKPKLPIIRLMSTGQKSEHSSASLTLRQVFKSIEVNNNETASSSDHVSKLVEQAVSCCSGASNNVKEETQNADPHCSHVQAIPTPERYESPKLPAQKKLSAHIQLLDINFPPKVSQIAVQSQPVEQPFPSTDENYVQELPPTSSLSEHQIKDGDISRPVVCADIASIGSVNGAKSEVHSSSPPDGILEVHDGYSTEEETMYSAETAESRNYTSPREVKFQQVGRSQSCVAYNRWGTVQGNPIARRAMLEKQRSFIHGRNVHSQGATSQRSNDYFSPKHQRNDYFSPTVSSIMKKRNNSELPTRPRRSAVQSSPRWMF
ncbi:hypothetical protein K2173_018689 [Erythroxylum novogranatense]|uniref:Uncharacterized protein n=1 Tax=Erythroxylum novogranatense TaxID=1862640 RepID=A0AAV8SAL8_9ROSI|nr:hypothetical protein K2173_018689 [Erythroxylum novogranatense]